MKKFNVNKKSEGVWFPYFGSIETDKKDKKGEPVIEYLIPEPNAGRVKIRVASAHVLDSIREKTTTRIREHAYNEHTKKMELVGGIEPQTYQQLRESAEMFWDHVIEDYEDLLDEAGNPIAVTFENKMMLIEDKEFARFVNRCIELHKLSEEERKKEIEKN